MLWIIWSCGWDWVAACGGGQGSKKLHSDGNDASGGDGDKSYECWNDDGGEYGGDNDDDSVLLMIVMALLLLMLS